MGNFSDYYDMGKEVMPSTHSYMEVNYAVRKRDNLEVVVKIRYKPSCFRSPEDERTWRQNTEFLLNMPDNCGVARLYEVLEDPKAFYVVMEKIEGMDLFETMEVQGKVSVPVAREILRKLLNSLEHLHGCGVVHKDLKLENVMVDMTPTSRRSPIVTTPQSVKVIDFDTVAEWTPSSPKSRDVVGTDQYIAQEAYAGRYSPLSDIFAAGVITYRLLIGKFPFDERTFDDEAGENWVGSPKMEEIRRRLKTAKVDFSHPVFNADPAAHDLVRSMLAYSELDRPDAQAALQHAWFKEGEEGGPSRARFPSDDLFDDTVAVAQESVVGDVRRQALLRT